MGSPGEDAQLNPVLDGQTSGGMQMPSEVPSAPGTLMGVGSSATFRATFKDHLDHALKLPIARSLGIGNLSAITNEDVKELFQLIGSGDRRVLSFNRFSMFVQEVYGCSNDDMLPAQRLIQLDSKQHMSIDDLHTALANDLGYYLHRLQARRAMKSLKDDDEDADKAEPTISRDFFVQRMVRRTDTDDALKTLPFTCLYVTVFMSLVILHLRIWERQEIDAALTRWMVRPPGVRQGPFIDEHVGNVAGYYAWMMDAAIPYALFNEDSVVQDSEGYWKVRLANSNFLVGDVLLRQQRIGSDEYLDEWLVSANSSVHHLQAHPGAYAEAVRQRVKYLYDTQWMGDHTQSLSLSFCTYNHISRMFAAVDVFVDFNMYGYIVPEIHVASVMSEPFGTDEWKAYATMFADVFFLLLIIMLVWTEGKEMCFSIRLGCGEFYDYWNMWNCLDWFSVFCGILIIFLWLWVLSGMQSDSLRSVLTDPDSDLVNNIMSFPVSDVAAVNEDLHDLNRRMIVFHLAMALNTISIVTKFFKGFAANPRLLVVIDTLVRAKEDIFHFMIVFCTVFLSFVLIANVLFGSDIEEFRSVMASVWTCWSMLMGDFDWYVELKGSRDTLPSGVPFWIVQGWYVTFMFFVLLVLLNMLLAVILERYNECQMEFKNSHKPPTLLTQCKQYLAQQKETSGFMSFFEIRALLENDADMAHKDPVVTEESLLEAFPKMKEKQAAYLMKLLQKELEQAEIEERDDESTQRAKRAESMVHRLNTELRKLISGLEHCENNMRNLEQKVDKEFSVMNGHDADFSTQGACEGSPKKEQLRESGGFAAEYGPHFGGDAQGGGRPDPPKTDDSPPPTPPADD